MGQHRNIIPVMMGSGGSGDGVVCPAHCPVLVTGPIVLTRSSLPWVDLLAAGPWDLNTD